jgi:hypothetical protein
MLAAKNTRRLKGSSSFAFLPIGSRLLREQRINHHWTPEDLAHGLGQNACDRIKHAGRGIRRDKGLNVAQHDGTRMHPCTFENRSGDTGRYSRSFGSSASLASPPFGE